MLEAALTAKEGAASHNNLGTAAPWVGGPCLGSGTWTDCAILSVGIIFSGKWETDKTQEQGGARQWEGASIHLRHIQD